MDEDRSDLSFNELHVLVKSVLINFNIELNSFLLSVSEYLVNASLSIQTLPSPFLIHDLSPG
jgi:hypothetical protein